MTATPPVPAPRPDPGGDERRWHAVLARDPRADGTFVFAVRSTGIYCRPTCPARRPRRDRVTFYPHHLAAERAGFRPCRRCRPDEFGHGGPDPELVRRACAELGGGETPTLADLAARVGVRPRRLRSAFQRVLGLTPREYAEARRLERFKELVSKGRSVAAALYEAGYGSSSRLYEASGPRLGMTPGRYRRGGRGVSIRFATTDTEFGRLLVAATSRGVCAVRFGKSDAELLAGLKREFAAAHMSRDDGALAWATGAITEHLSGRVRQLNLPLDVQATAFQWRVWKALRAIPFGDVRSYGALARSIGSPRAARAVGAACAANPVALIIPCHRAVRADGSPGGYRWGSDRKQALLDREARAARSPRP